MYLIVLYIFCSLYTDPPVYLASEAAAPPPRPHRRAWYRASRRWGQAWGPSTRPALWPAYSRFGADYIMFRPLFPLVVAHRLRLKVLSPPRWSDPALTVGVKSGSRTDRGADSVQKRAASTTKSVSSVVKTGAETSAASRSVPS